VQSGVRVGADGRGLADPLGIRAEVVGEAPGPDGAAVALRQGPTDLGSSDIGLATGRSFDTGMLPTAGSRTTRRRRSVGAYARGVLTTPDESIAAYVGLRHRVTELLASVDDDRAATTGVPACPAWSVTDLAAHLYGVVFDILDGNIAGAGTAAWADEQVRRFAPLGLHDVVDQWNRTSPDLEAVGASFPPRPAAQFVFDACSHEHDLRGALGAPGGRTADSVVVGVRFIADGLQAMVDNDRVPAIELETPEFAAVIGAPPVSVGLSSSSFEVLRSFSGRRSTDQFRALGWRGDPTPLLSYFEESPLRPPATALVE
jgi:uncharacterized protein (TIGR03083 family)